MRNTGILILITMLMCSGVSAGNRIFQVPVIKESNNKSIRGQKADYVLNGDVNIFFDNDINGQLAKEVFDGVRKDAPDLNLSYTVSAKDWKKSTDLYWPVPFKELRFAPNRIFVFKGSGFIPNFAASLRMYDSGKATCFAHIRKDQFDTADFVTRKKILDHEVRHCFGWDHKSSENVFTDNWDFTKIDHRDPILRVYDKGNTQGTALVSIIKPENITIGFEPIMKRQLKNKTVYTHDENAKLEPGKYIVKIGDYYICNRKKKKGLKLCKKRKNAKRKKLISGDEWDLDISRFFINND